MYVIVSIPHSEFCSFGRVAAPKIALVGNIVSIPHSEFCSFGLLQEYMRMPKDMSFNSPFGILFVRTQPHVLDWKAVATVSIPHSEFCSFGRFISFGSLRSLLCFNSPFGILFVRTPQDN